MSSKKQTPKVRFAGYTEGWEEKELNKILTERNVLQKISEDAPILAFAARQGVIDRSQRKSNNRDHLTHDQENKIYKLTEVNDIVYNPANLKYGAIDRNKFKRGVLSPIYVTFTTEEEASFIELIVKSEKFKLKALQFEEGTVVKRQSVKPENLLSLKVNISPFKEEQQQIGSFFQNIDTLITQHQQKLQKLHNLKKAMLVKLFPKEGATVPEIRFKGFSGEWEEKELSSLFEIIDGDRGKNYPGESDFFKSGHTLFLDTGNVRKNGFQLSTKKFINEKKDCELGAGKLKLFDFVLTSRGTLGNLGYYDEKISLSHASVRINSAMLIFRPLKRNLFSDLFLLTVLRGNTLESFMIKNKVGSAQPHITKREISKHRINIPINLEEQQKIGSYFKNLDTLINQYQTQLEKLQQLKKACLSSMFV